MHGSYHSANQLPSATGLRAVSSAEHDDSPHSDFSDHPSTDDSLDAQDLHAFYDTGDQLLDALDFDINDSNAHLLPDTRGSSPSLSSLASSLHDDGEPALAVHTEYHPLINGRPLTCHLYDTLDRYIQVNCAITIEACWTMSPHHVLPKQGI